MNWSKITLSKKDVARGKITEIQHLFRDILESYYTDFNMSEVVMLCDDLSHKKFIIYFSPKCLPIPGLVELLDVYSATKCDPPSTGRIRFLCGDIGFAQQFLRYKR